MREYVSDYIGLPLLTRGGERIGYVKNVQTDKNLTRVRNLECCDEEEEEFILPLSAAASFGEGAIVVRSPAAKGCKNCLPAPIGKEAFSTEGAPLGRVRDFGREEALIRTIILSDGQELAAERVAGVTDTVLIDLSEDFVPKPVTRAKRKAAQAGGKEAGPQTNAADGISAEDGAAAEDDTARRPEATPAGEEEPLTVRAAFPPTDEAESVTVRAAFSPTDGEESEIAADDAANADGGPAPYRPRKAAGRGLLTGKVLPQDLLDARGNVLARAGTEVSADVILCALRHDKLFELTLLCCSTSPFGLWR